MKKAIVIFLSLTMLLSAGACSSNKENSQSTPSEIVQPAEQIQLTNKMTENERQRADKHELTLLIESKETTNTEQTDHKVSVEFSTISIEELRENVESNHDLNLITDEDYETAMKEIRSYEEKGENTCPLNSYILISCSTLFHTLILIMTVG